MDRPKDREEDGMDTRNGTKRSEARSIDGTTVTDRRPLQRVFLFAALICFALPFLTVTCYGEETTVSGIEAATSIDLDPSNSYGERELEREESANLFAFLALVSTAAALVFAFRMQDPRGVAFTTVIGVISLEALLLYALERAVGEAFPRIGFVGALFLLLGAAWTTVDRVPRWIPVAIGALAISMLPGAVVPAGDVSESPVLYVPIVFGGMLAVAFAVGVLHRPAGDPATPAPPSTPRLAIAGIVAIVILAVAIVGGFFLAAFVSSGTASLDENGYLFALVIITSTVAGSFGAWAAGRAITRPRPLQAAAASIPAFPIA